MKYSTYIKPRRRTPVKVSRSVSFYTKRIKKLVLSLIPVFAVIAVVYGVYLVVFDSSVFNLDSNKIEIYGTGSFVDAQAFKDRVYFYVLDKNVIKLNDSKIEEMLLVDFPSIKSVSLKKKIPPYLIVNVVERVPAFALYKDDSNNAYMIDKEGFVLGPLEDKFKDLFKVQYAGDILEQTFVHLDIITMYQDVLSGADFVGLTVSKVILGTDETYIYLPENVEVLLSNKKDVHESFSIISSILLKFDAQEKKITKIDLRYDKVIVSYD